MSADKVWSGRCRPVAEYEPFDDIRVGSVIRWNGRLRTVRLVRRNPLDDSVHVIGFAKLRRSGYPSPLTLYWRSEIRAAFGGIVAHRKGALCATDLECKLTRDIETDNDRPAVTERETVGVIW